MRAGREGDRGLSRSGTPPPESESTHLSEGEHFGTDRGSEAVGDVVGTDGECEHEGDHEAHYEDPQRRLRVPRWHGGGSGGHCRGETDGYVKLAVSCLSKSVARSGKTGGNASRARALSCRDETGRFPHGRARVSNQGRWARQQRRKGHLWTPPRRRGRLPAPRTGDQSDGATATYFGGVIGGEPAGLHKRRRLDAWMDVSMRARVAIIK